MDSERPLPPVVQIGLERFLDAPREWIASDARLGLLMNQSSVDYRFRYAADLLAKRCPGQLVRLFSPQHGMWSEQQANMIETSDQRHPRLRIPIHSLYSHTRRPTPEMLEGLDVLVIDLQDVGCRVYTYLWTVRECLLAAAESGLRVLVLDRPNPLGGLAVEGPRLRSEYRSFVGGAEMPMRHGLTMGEAARWLRRTQSINVELEVVPAEGWRRSMLFPDWRRDWVAPSPNLPIWESSRIYPGMVLLEGTNLSEGRGTTRPFEQVGAPYLDGEQLANQLTRSAEVCGMSGVLFRPMRFEPTFDKWAGQSCGGVFLHVTDSVEFSSYLLSVLLLMTVSRLAPAGFQWLGPPYEYETQRMPIDILHGSDELRLAVDQFREASVATDWLQKNVSDVAALATVDADAWWSDVSSDLLYTD